MGDAADGSRFLVMACGQIESAQFEGSENLYCRYQFQHGPDWEVMHGLEQGITQMSSSRPLASEGSVVVWNFPIDVTLKSTNVFGWPQIMITVYGDAALGQADQIQGYGAVHLPVAPGKHTLYIRTFRPIASKWLDHFISFFHGMRPEYKDPRLVARGEGREVTRVQSCGVVKITVNVSMQGMEALGYHTPPPAPRTVD
ncbi:B9 domain-containing protein 1 [Pavlovales sp. CCMP2436]|nr:B9 domain-containing protein 1 [Pavlovales sp. CCMP2436]